MFRGNCPAGRLDSLLGRGLHLDGDLRAGNEVSFQFAACLQRLQTPGEALVQAEERVQQHDVVQADLVGSRGRLPARLRDLRDDRAGGEDGMERRVLAAHERVEGRLEGAPFGVVPHLTAVGCDVEGGAEAAAPGYRDAVGSPRHRHLLGADLGAAQEDSQIRGR
jgi:hypothetical protein